MKSLYLAAGLALIAVPANAAVSTTQPSSPAKEAKAEETKYCFTYEAETGSRIDETKCKTKAEWAREGVDVDELLRK